MDLAEPQCYPRRLLLMVTGRTPQVVTETLYALCVKQNPPFIPTEVHLITTSEGAQDARLSLLADSGGWFHRLCADYTLHGIEFTADNIHVIRNSDGCPVPDIRTQSEHEACADLITETVRRFTTNPNTALHVSLAGGRKTMTYYLGNALTLFGRSQDRLSHVLVSSPYESNREFFYPTPESQPLFVDPLKRYFDAHEAEVTLAEIPFVRLRDGLPGRFKTLESGGARFTDVVGALQKALEPPSVTVDYFKEELRLADGITVGLGGADLAFYGWLARRNATGTGPVRIPSKNIRGWKDGERTEYVAYLGEYLAEANRVDVRDGTGTELRAVGAMTYNFFHQRKTSIKEQLEEVLGPLARAYEVAALTEGRPARYGLAVAPERIRFIGEGSL